MAEPWIRYQPQNEGNLYQPEKVELPYSQGLEPFSGIMETVDYLTTAPIRGGISQAQKTGPWSFFKGAYNSLRHPNSTPNATQVAKQSGLSDTPLYQNSGRLSFGGLASKLSPAQVGGFVGENILDPSNLVPVGKAMAVGGLALGGLKKVGKELGEGSLKQAKQIKLVEDISTDQLQKISNHMRLNGFDIRGAKDARDLMMERSGGDISKLSGKWKDAIESVIGNIQKQTKQLEKKDLSFIKRKMGVTTDWREAGYINPDGSLLDFSGKNQGGPSGNRSLDHRDIVLPESMGGETGYDRMINYMNNGGIRIDANSGLINIRERPTQKQKLKIAEFMRNSGENDFFIEIGDRAFERQYPKTTKPQKVLKDIEDFLDGKEPAPISKFMGGLAPVGPWMLYQQQRDNKNNRRKDAQWKTK